MIGTEDIPDDIDGDVLRRMRSQGDSLQAPRDIDFNILFSDEAPAIEFCRSFDPAEFRCRYKRYDEEEGLSWNVTVSRHMVPHHADIVAHESRLQELATHLEGEVDGWGCFNVQDIPQVGERGDG